MTITSQDLPAILAAHREWLTDPSKGTRANLSGANLFEANLSGANLSRADLSRANLSGANLTEADLFEANLFEANLSGANLSRADLSRANLSGANLSGANLSGANLTEANLSGANLTEAHLSRANLSGANLICGGARSDGYEFFGIREAEGAVMVRAACRYLSVADARAHWTETRPGTRLGDESLAILDHLERMARIAGWLPRATQKTEAYSAECNRGRLQMPIADQTHGLETKTDLASGMPMKNVRVGMRLRNVLQGRDEEIEVTEITERGFKYRIPEYRHLIAPHWGMQLLRDGHEHFGVRLPNGDHHALFQEVVSTMTADAHQTQKPANDDASPAVTAINLTDLAAMSGIDEDTLLQRLAGIMDARVEKAEADAKPKLVTKP